MNNTLHNIIEEWIGDDYSKHICRYNDGEFICECYGEALKDLRSRIPELEEKIREEISNKVFEHAKTTGQLVGINTIQVLDIIKLINN